MKKLCKLAVVVALALPVVSTTAADAAPYCGIRWGSGPKTLATMSAAPVTNARTGQHQCFDRLVIDLRGAPSTGFSVRYVNQFKLDGSGQVVQLNGGAKIEVYVNAPAYDSNGNPTYWRATGARVANVSRYRTFRDLKYGGSFEGRTLFGLGVAGRLPFRVTQATGNGRVVIDVAHRWCTNNGPC